MLAYSSHLCQPLDIGCFSLLKQAYSQQVKQLMQHQISHITKVNFLLAFKKAFNQVITKLNIRASFRGAGLVPYNLQEVLLKLDIKLCTLTLLALLELQELKTPSTAQELGAQSTLVCTRICQHLDSSPIVIVKLVNQLAYSSQRIELKAVLLHNQICTLQSELRATIEHRKQSRKCIKNQKTLTKVEGAKIIA